MEIPHQPYFIKGFQSYWDGKHAKKVLPPIIENAILGASRTSFQILLLCLGLMWDTTRKTLVRLQNRAFRIITNSAYDLSVGPLLRQLKLPSISDSIKQESASMVYKALITEVPLYLKEQFTRVSTITSKTLRGSDLSLRPQRFKISLLNS